MIIFGVRMSTREKKLISIKADKCIDRVIVDLIQVNAKKYEQFGAYRFCVCALNYAAAAAAAIIQQKFLPLLLLLFAFCHSFATKNKSNYVAKRI